MHQCISLLICSRARRESHCPLLPTGRSNPTGLIVQSSSRQYPSTLPAARYQEASWAAMHSNRFYWLEWCALLAMTLADRSLLRGCPPPHSSHKATNLAINATHFNRTSAVAQGRTEEEKSGRAWCQITLLRWGSQSRLWWIPENDQVRNQLLPLV